MRIFKCGVSETHHAETSDDFLMGKDTEEV